MEKSIKLTPQMIEDRKMDCPFLDCEMCGRYEGRKLPCDGACSWVVDFATLLELDVKYGKEKDVWKDFEEELVYRVERAQNEPIDDMDWFIENAMKELKKYARVAVAKEQTKDNDGIHTEK